MDVRDVGFQESFDVDPFLENGSERVLLANPKEECGACVGRFFRPILNKVNSRYCMREDLRGEGAVCGSKLNEWKYY